MKLIDVTRQFKTDDDCLDYIEKMRWPNGELSCVHCGEVGRISKITREKKGKNQRTRLYQCLACGKQFSATSGTIFNDSHLPLTKWFMAIAMVCEAKKAMSAFQLQRHLGVNYRTAWHLAHRIREAIAIGENHTQHIESAFSLLKRGVCGTFHKVSIKHLGRYCNEFSYKFNRRGEQLQMFDGTLMNLVRGKVLPYSKLTASQVSETWNPCGLES